MAKEVTAYQAAKKADPKGYDKLGGYDVDFAKRMSRQLPFDRAFALLTKFPALLQADGRKARLRGRSFEASRKREWYDLPAETRVALSTAHEDKSCKLTSRDRKFAAALPQSLRKEFYEVAKSNMESEYSSGMHTVSFNRALKRIDEEISTPWGRAQFELRNNIEYHRRFEMGM